MKRATLIAFAVFAAAAAGWVGLQRSAAKHSAPGSAAQADRGRAAGLDAGLSVAVDGGRADRDAPGRSLDDELDETDNDAGGVLLDGGAVPELVAESPKAVVFGVILIQYAGAQGAPPGTRSREQALAQAESLVELARKDFEAAVKKGDPGSTDNAGKMYRGILEPAPEYVLFSLNEGEVSEPVDTPRGFWIVKRID